MNSGSKYKIFLLVSLNKLNIVVSNSQNINLYNKEIITKDKTISENLNSLNSFLNENVFKIEKKLKEFINNIILIIDYDDLFFANLTIKQKSENKILEDMQINNLLTEAKNRLIETLGENKMVHMIIDKFIIDGLAHDKLPNNIKCKNFALEITFVCLPNFLFDNLKKILNTYQISISEILSYKYVSSFQSSDNESFTDVAVKVLNGLNENEVKNVKKPNKIKSIFERFFHFWH